MVCLYCGGPTSVVNSRHQRRGNSIWRRRVCSSCGGIFTTEEHIALTQGFRVQDARGQLHPFRRDQLFLSIFESCKHRMSALPDATSLTQLVIDRLLQQRSALLKRDEVVRTCAAALKQFDPVAAAVYVAYHPVAQK